MGVIERALQVTTRRLLAELGAAHATAPEWNSFEWAVARAASAMQGISGLLCNHLAWQGPQEWQRFLREQRAHIEARAVRINELRALVDDEARKAGIAFIGLKGSALLDLGLYPPGARPMSDIDLLVRPQDLASMQKIVGALGYRNIYTTDRHAVFGPEHASQPRSYGEHRDHPVRIELHPQVCEVLPVSPVDVTTRLWPTMTSPGNNPYASMAALLAHEMLHAAGSMRARALRALHLYDIAMIARRMQDSDWQVLAADAARDGWWMYPPLMCAEYLLTGSVPSGLLAQLRRHCPPWLRLRRDYDSIYRRSWSNPRIPAIAGLEWCRSPREVLQLVEGRLWARRGVQSVAAEPHLQHFAWYGMTRAERLVRWVFTRPGRTQTLFVVSCALRS